MSRLFVIMRRLSMQQFVNDVFVFLMLTSFGRDMNQFNHQSFDDEMQDFSLDKWDEEKSSLFQYVHHRTFSCIILQKSYNQCIITFFYFLSLFPMNFPQKFSFSSFAVLCSRVSVFFLCVVMLTWCFGKKWEDAISNWPIGSGDHVWVDTVIVAPRFPDVVWDTTDEAVAQKQTQYPLARQSFVPELFILDQDTVAADIVQTLIGKNVGDEVIVTVSPSAQKQAQYALTNTTSLPWDLFDRAGISLRVWDIRLVDTQWWVIREIVGDRPNHQYIVDLNPRDTYMDLEYRLTVKQIWGESYEGE